MSGSRTALERAESALEKANKSATEAAWIFLALVALGTCLSFGLERALWVMAAIFGCLLLGGLEVFTDAKKAVEEAQEKHDNAD